MADYTKQAKSYAQQRANEIKTQLSSMYSNLETARQSQMAAFQARKEQLYAQIGQKKTEATADYGRAARSTFVNKMKGQGQLSGQLASLGLGSSGYALNQGAEYNSAYMGQLGDLDLQRKDAMSALATEEGNANMEFDANKLSADTQYSSSKMSLDQFVEGQANAAYEAAYSRYIQQKQFEAQMRAAAQQQQAAIDYEKKIAAEKAGYAAYWNPANRATTGGGTKTVGGNPVHQLAPAPKNLIIPNNNTIKRTGGANWWDGFLAPKQPSTPNTYK